MGQAVRVLRWPFAENDRAVTEARTAGLVKAFVDRRGRVLGASILGAHAGELISLWSLALRRKIAVSVLAELIVPYPTMSEASKRAAGAFYAPRLFSARTRRIVRLLARLG